MAQAPPAQPPAQPGKKAAPPSRVATRPVDRQKNAPQVVTIVHRLNGLKMFRLLLRSEQHLQAVDRLDSSFSLMDDVHTNVIAGLAMDDGETIAAWLPEANVEFGPPDFPAPDVSTPSVPAPTTAGPGTRDPWQGFAGNFFQPPDVTVIGSDGKPLVAKYVGLDAITGLSILRLADKNPAAVGAINEDPVDVGESVRLFGPEPVTGQPGLLNSGLYVRIGATEGKVFDVRRAPTGGVARFRVSSPRLSQSIIGGVAINEAGETVGIVDKLEGGEASVLPTAVIRRAARRVLDRQASVPKPWLGVQGVAVAQLKLDQFLNHGWKPERAAALAEDHQGILLTSIIPDSPAAQASLRAGDVILKVNNQEIDNGEDFTWFLEQAGPSSSVSFTVARPDRTVTEALDVKLSGKLDSGFKFSGFPRTPAINGFLLDQGIETIALRQGVASQLGTTAGLLVVYVEAGTAAFEAGLQPGDVIQSINGQSVSPFRRFASPNQLTTMTFQVVRGKDKLVITLKNPAKKK
ncbi:MAG TPA: PDZ domain-containing protein [Pyrinomonadaceae bacterium]|nr:PDZ domain-containing protein [Pyrinomonadaceae bacterium]